MMNHLYTLPIFLVIGTLGGLVGSKIKIPAGALVGALIAVVLFKVVTRVHWDVPRSFTFILQVFLGIMVGATFQPEMLKVLGKVIIPVVTSTLFLVGMGMALAVIFARFGLLDIGTAYLGTSPGAMSALLVLALDTGTSSTVVTCFHFFRVVFIILTTPLIFKFFFNS